MVVVHLGHDHIDGRTLVRDQLAIHKYIIGQADGQTVTHSLTLRSDGCGKDQWKTYPWLE